MFDLKTIKKAFFEKVLTIPGANPAYRLVAQCDGLEDDYESGLNHIVGIWNPNDHPERNYNLVLSLTSHGNHRPLCDWDRPTKPDGLELASLVDKRTIWFRSGSGNWHGYLNYFPTTLEVATMVAGHPFDELADVPEKNKYAEHVKKQGYASLRPPWIQKNHGALNPEKDFNQTDWEAILPENFLDGVTTSTSSAWEEMFNED